MSICLNFQGKNVVNICKFIRTKECSQYLQIYKERMLVISANL